MPANLENSAGATGLERSVFIPIPKKGIAKECSNYCIITLISCTSKVILKIQARLQQYVNCELPDVQAGFRKGRGTRDQIANICWIIEKASNFRKASTSVSLTTQKPLTIWITTNCGKILKEMGMPEHLTCLLIPNRPQGSPASSSVWREDPGLLSRPCRKRSPHPRRAPLTCSGWLPRAT